MGTFLPASLPSGGSANLRTTSPEVLVAVLGQQRSGLATSSLSSSFYPQSNGQTERKNQDMEVALQCMVSQDPASWSSLMGGVHLQLSDQFCYGILPILMSLWLPASSFPCSQC